MNKQSRRHAIRDDRRYLELTWKEVEWKEEGGGDASPDVHIYTGWTKV